jgi:hypothetical protein
VRKADNLTTILCRFYVIWEPGPLQACNETALPFFYISHNKDSIIIMVIIIVIVIIIIIMNSDELT